MGKYPLCKAVEDALVEQEGFKADEQLTLVLKAYDNSYGCINEAVWSMAKLEESIAAKFRAALKGVLRESGYDPNKCVIVIEPDAVGTTAFTVTQGDTVILSDYCKPWNFGHMGGCLEELEGFFAHVKSCIEEKVWS